MPAVRIRFAVTLSLALACGGESTTTMTGGSTDDATGATGSTDASASTSTGAAPTTSTSATSEGPGGTDSGTEGASGGDTTGASTTEMSGTGTGGEGSGMACAKWYAAIAESYGPTCECEVQQGNFESVEQCMMALAPPADCACPLFAESPESAELLACYEEAAKAKTKCVEALPNLCLGGMPLDLCVTEELAALVECGAPPAELCADLKAMCGDAVPPVCG